MKVKITPHAFTKLIEAGFSCYQNGFSEKCGIIISEEDIIVDIIEGTEKSSPAYCTLDYGKLAQVRNNLQDGRRISCWFHFHNGFCTPSSTDVNTQKDWEAFGCDYSVLVDALHAEVRIWGLNGGKVVYHEFEIEPEIPDYTNLKLDEVFIKQKDHIDLQLMRLKKIAIFGVGQLGSQAGLYLAKSGIGSLLLLDKDSVELRNTNVQLLYSPDDIGSQKSEVIAERLGKLAPWTKVSSVTVDIPMGYEPEEEYERKFKEICDLLKDIDAVLCCFDNIESRVTVAKICKKLNIPMIDAGVLAKNGQVLTTIWNKTPCIACLNLSGAGSRPCILTSTVCSGSMVSSLQASIAIDYLHAKEVPEFVTVDLENYNVSRIRMKRNPDCWLCGDANG